MKELFSSVETEGIKYAGSKLKLLPYILEICRDLGPMQTVLDGFSGTTRVAQAFAQLGYRVTANDIADWSEVFATCYLKADKPIAYYQAILDHLNSLPGYDGWFSAHYGGAENSPKKPFQLKNTQKLDAIRDEIEKLGLCFEDKCVILTSLILALDKVDSTLGHFASYLSKWSGRSFKELVLQMPKKFPLTQKHQVSRGDVFSLLPANEWDLAYFDPPYGSNNAKMPSSRVRYNAYYHLWTTVIRNDRPELFGKANRRADSRDLQNPSAFESYKTDEKGTSTALKTLEQLVAQTKVHYLLLSYSSGGRASRQDLTDILSAHGKIKKILEIDYKKNVMAQMRYTHQWVCDNEPKKHLEYLFLLEK